MGLKDSANNIISGLSRPGGRPPLEGLYAYALAAFAGLIVSDTAINSYRPSMLPTDPPKAKMQKQLRQQRSTPATYANISQRNIFNADGKIPDPISAEEKDEGPVTGEPVRSSLSFLKLLGTIVHFNPKMSIATVNISNRNKTLAFKVGEEIQGVAKVTKVERRKMIFINLQNNRLEFIDIPEDLKLNFGFSKPKAKPVQTGEVRTDGDNKFTIDRATLNKYTTDLSSILRQARMLPNNTPDGGIDGFKFVSIQPGSIFEKLGFKVGDSIKSVNGEPVNSPTKAMEMYNVLKSENSVQIGLERDGREDEFDYTITE